MTSGLRQDGTAKSVPRNQFRRRERGQGKHHFPLLSDHEQEWQPYLVHPYFPECADHAYIQSPRYGSSSRFLQQYRDKKRRLHFPAEGDMVCSTRVRRAVSNGPNFFSEVQNIRRQKNKKLNLNLFILKDTTRASKLSTRARVIVIAKGSPGQSKDTKKPSTKKIIVVHTTAKTIQK